MILTVTPIYAALLGLFYIGLAVRVIRYRRGNRISLGDAEDKAMRKRLRVHGNFAEYAPLALILLLLVELQDTPALAVHALGLSLLAGRVLHAAGLGSTPQRMNLRVTGMVLTLSMIAVAALLLLLGPVL
ncbi:MAG: MAPEG family protein [Pseudomonadota bacterium]